MRREVHVIDAFTRERYGGNRAGVVPDAEGLGEGEMLRIAAEVNASETVFMTASARADARARFFTPRCEVDFCGHAFLAGAYYLGLQEVWFGETFRRLKVETNVGVLPAELISGGEGLSVEMTQAAPMHRPYPRPIDELGAAVGLAPEALVGAAPAALAYTGLWHLLVPVEDAALIAAARPDHRAIAALNREVGATTTHLFAPDGEGYTCRGFAPAVGVDEDPVTGSACGALGAYLHHHGELPSGVEAPMRQRDLHGRGGLAYVRVEEDEGRPLVKVRGHAAWTISGELIDDG